MIPPWCRFAAARSCQKMWQRAQLERSALCTAWMRAGDGVVAGSRACTKAMRICSAQRAGGTWPMPVASPGQTRLRMGACVEDRKTGPGQHPHAKPFVRLSFHTSKDARWHAEV